MIKENREVPHNTPYPTRSTTTIPRYSGQTTATQAFIALILQKDNQRNNQRQANVKSLERNENFENPLDITPRSLYNNGKVFSDVRAQTKGEQL